MWRAFNFSEQAQIDVKVNLVTHSRHIKTLYESSTLHPSETAIPHHYFPVLHSCNTSLRLQQLPLSGDTGTSPRMEAAKVSQSRLLGLPYELRQRIFRLALKQRGTVELQHPLWAEKQVFAQPLFQLCKALRNEALEAFYKANSFLWIVEVDNHVRSNPAHYNHDSSAVKPPVLVPALPWQYPQLLGHLRQLHLNIYLPSDQDADAWSIGFAKLLSELIQALDYGRRLRSLQVLLTTKRYHTKMPLSSSQRNVLDSLSQMKVRGKVQVRMRYDFGEVKASIESLNLEKRMRY